MEHDPSGMSFRDLLLEVRRDVKEVFQKVDQVETRLDTEVITKSEFRLWKETMRQTRRWAITTIISLMVLGIMIATIVINRAP